MIAEELYPKIIVFHDALKNPKEFEKMISDDSGYVNKWTQWYSLGEQTNFTTYKNILSNKFPSKEEWDENFKNIENTAVLEVSKLFFDATKNYVDKYKINLPNWSHYSPHILSHVAKTTDNQLAMQYHTDYVMSQTENPGYKFWITALLYVNDDYEGGEIAFKIFKNETEVIDHDNFDYFKYKPKAGDLLILPAHHPYYHGVLKTKTNKKLFVRLFWGHEYDGSANWRANEQKYGKEVWANMEKQRLDEEFRTSKWMMGSVEEL